jgi:hypothetical protein
LLLLRRSLRLGNRDKSFTDDLTTAALKALEAEIGLKHLEQFVNHACFTKPLSEKLDAGGPGCSS